MTPEQKEPHGDIDKRKLRLILPCDEYGFLWIKGAHLHDEDFCRGFIESRKHFRGSKIGNICIDSHGYCQKILQKNCNNPYEWVCEGDYAWFDCSKEAKNAVPYTQIEYESLWDDEK